MLTTECCPQCKREADSSRVRLVRDSCGHRKCRECLVNEEAGCLLCSCYTPVYTELTPARDASSDPIQSTEPEPVATFSEASAVSDSVAHGSSEGTEYVNQLESTLLSICPTDLNGELEEVEQAEKPAEISNIAGKKMEKIQPTYGLKEHIVFTPGDPPKYFCKKCKKSYNNRKAARYHNYCGASNDEKPHKCNECGQGFITNGHLEYHMKSHTGLLPFTCKSCDKGFKQLSKLNRHLKSHEGGSEKPFRCNLCEKSLSTKQNLKDHMLSHSKGHFVICPICNKKLSSQSCLRKHKKLHADPVHKCKDCSKTFPVKWSLDVHMRSHQRESKFKCKLCNRAFKIQSDLKRHAVVHQEDGEWDCKICLLIFRRRDNLVRHMKNIHPESPLVVASSRQGGEKDLVEGECKPKNQAEDCAKKTTSPMSNAVSVIRGLAVPVIEKTEAKVENSNSVSNRNLTFNDNNLNKECAGQNTCEEDNNYSLSDSITSIQPISVGMDQNFHRGSVVCHSDARGVVHYGSSTLERVSDATKVQQESIEVPYDGEQFQVYEPYPIIIQSENSVIHNNIVQRPRVIVAKETFL